MGSSPLVLFYDVLFMKVNLFIFYAIMTRRHYLNEKSFQQLKFEERFLNPENIDRNETGIMTREGFILIHDQLLWHVSCNLYCSLSKLTFLY